MARIQIQKEMLAQAISTQSNTARLIFILKEVIGDQIVLRVEDIITMTCGLGGGRARKIGKKESREIVLQSAYIINTKINSQQKNLYQ